MSVKIDSDKKTLESFLGGGDGKNKTIFVVPDFQRSYDWRKTELETMLEDLTIFGRSDEEDEEYFLGSTVLFTQDDEKIYNIVDGQQRITSLFLFMRYMYKYCEKMNIAEEDSELWDTRDNLFSILSSLLWKEKGYTRKPDMSQPRLVTRIIYDDGDTSLQDILRTGEAQRRSKNNYDKNYQVIENYFESEYSDIPNDKLLNMFFKIIKETWVICIQTNDLDSAMKIFENINAKGRRLETYDVYKSRIYGSLASKEEKDKFITFWNESFDRLNNIKTSKKVSFATVFDTYGMFLYAVDGRTATNTTKFKKLYFSPDDPSHVVDGYKDGYYEKIISFMETAITCTPSGTIKDEQWSTNSEILAYINILYFSNVQNILKSACVHYMYNHDNENFEQEFLDFCKRLVSFALSVSVNEYNSSSISATILNFNSIACDSKDSILGSMLKIPTENDIRDYIVSIKINRGTSGKAGKSADVILRLYNYRKHGTDVLLDQNLEREHIVPVKWQAEWKLGHGSIPLSPEQEQEYVGNIGNVTLLPKSMNIMASNGFFDEKKKVYETSGVPMTEALCSLDDFDANSIINRCKDISNEIIEIMDEFPSFNDYVSKQAPHRITTEM